MASEIIIKIMKIVASILQHSSFIPINKYEENPNEKLFSDFYFRPGEDSTRVQIVMEGLIEEAVFFYSI